VCTQRERALPRRFGWLLAAAALPVLLVASACGHPTGGKGTCKRPRTIAAPALSRPSARIAFVDPREGITGAIYSIRLDGKGLRRIATEAWFPAVSPNRRYLVFERGGNKLDTGIFFVHRDGTHLRWIAHDRLDAFFGQPAWSPDGRRLVVVANGIPSDPGRESLFPASLITMNPDGSARRHLSAAPLGFDFPGPSWIDSRRILITTQVRGAPRFALIDARTGRVRRWIIPPAGHRGTQPAADRPALSPDGRYLAYAECTNDDCSATSVDMITVRGRLVRSIRGAGSPAWSPRGELLYSSHFRVSYFLFRKQIMLAPAAGGAARAITPCSVSADQPVWLG
jgi:Tol biopolymer transport system component